MDKQSRIMRSAWTGFVKKTREKLNRKKKKGEEQVGWRSAMKIASEKWPAEKLKIERKRKREQKKALGETKRVKVTKIGEEKAE